jgi:putative transposase
MARIPRLVLPGIPHHITQRGNNRRQVFFNDADHRLYLRLLRENADKFKLQIWGYCLMPNHIHLIAAPEFPDSLSRTLGRTHATFAQIANIRAESSGHVWQNRFFSCPMDDAHTWAALAYVERNPVRAGLTRTAAAYPWSSAQAHLGGPDPFGALALSPWRDIFDTDSWQLALSALSRDQALEIRIRDSSRTGRPLANPLFQKPSPSALLASA